MKIQYKDNMLISRHQNVVCKNDQGRDAKNYQTAVSALCSAQCVTCPKQFYALYFDVNVFIKRYVLSVAETTYRISSPMFRVLCAYHKHQGEMIS